MIAIKRHGYRLTMTKLMKYLSLFLVSAYVLGLEVFLNRYFAIVTWAEYGYWIISIVMVGFALSGVCLSLFENFFQRNRPAFLFWLPFLLLFVSALSFQLICLNRFNPLELQHEVLWPGQLLHILYYYLALFPVFFLAGLYIGMIYLELFVDIARVYACNLIGSAVGSLLVLFFLYFIHPFYLLAALLPLLALAALCHLFVLRYSLFLTGLIFLLAITGFCEWRIIEGNMAHFPEYKAVYPALNVEGNKVVAEKRSPDGYYLLLDNFNERRNIDLSNNYGLLKVCGPPAAIGLYRDGNRITGLYKGGLTDLSYFSASLDAFPYLLKPTGKYLLIGTDGGFKLHEIWGAKRNILAVEPTRTIYDLVKKGVDGMAGIRLSCNSPLAVLEPGSFDLIDMGADFLTEGDANRYAVTVEALTRYLLALKDEGMLSIPVTIAEFPVYATKMLATVKMSLQRSGVDDPGKHVMVYRSSLSARILVSRRPFTEGDIARMKTFCGDRSFDTSWYAGINPDQVPVWNDLPAVSFTTQMVEQKEKAADALMESAVKIFQSSGVITLDSFFHLEPATLDRPFFFSILPISQLGTLLSRVSVIPQPEIGQLINLAVLFQAVLLACLVILLPLIRRKAAVADQSLLRTVIYFACLGLGFLFIEIALIERCTFFLNDSTTAFAVVLTGMLLFSGFGSYHAAKFDPLSAKGVKWAVLRIIICLVLYVFLLTPVLSLLIPLSKMIKIMVILIMLAPISFAMGLPFPLGLSSLQEKTGYLLPWAWSINGAFSVIATPLANLVAVTWGIPLLMFLAVFLYFIALWAYPAMGPVPAGERTQFLKNSLLAGTRCANLTANVGKGAFLFLIREDHKSGIVSDG